MGMYSQQDVERLLDEARDSPVGSALLRHSRHRIAVGRLTPSLGSAEVEAAFADSPDSSGMGEALLDDLDDATRMEVDALAAAFLQPKLEAAARAALRAMSQVALDDWEPDPATIALMALHHDA